MSPETALPLWQEREETLAAIREGLEDVEVGRTYPERTMSFGNFRRSWMTHEVSRADFRSERNGRHLRDCDLDQTSILQGCKELGERIAIAALL